MTTTIKPNAPKVMPDLPPQVAMLQMLGGMRVARIIYTASALRIADLLAEAPKTSQELAEATKTHAPSLYRVLRALASVGVFAEDEDGRFHLTPNGEFLRHDTPDAIGPMVNVLGEDWHWQVWGRLLESVQTGEAAFDRIHGMELYDYCQQNPDFARTHGPSKTSVSARASAALLANYDFSGMSKVVDVAVLGGYGNTLIPLLTANPTMQGVLYDLPFVIEGAQPVIAASGIGDRCELLHGHCLDSVPTGGDAYVLMFVIHNWDDQRAIKILQNCREAMTATGKVLLVEMVMPSGNDPFVGKFVDLESLLTTPGGYERTEAQYRSLLETAGYRLTRIIPTQTANSILEAEKA
ncbi:methyltransferase [Leptolyngbya sp. FACHB-36]|uniref:methyltransferase n=1 Tax=Leptolyngbya sp. FACHB-36 TaxID=2692808 RepID=UPI00168121D9|nr:methyltransferase [Leptolyngbya sp. FACHB-36]MBD2018597.1 methyltransferase [Leptolyngbya sp. FACHB-36]